MKTGQSTEDIHIFFEQIGQSSSRQRDSLRHHWNNWGLQLGKVGGIDATVPERQVGRNGLKLEG